MKSMVITSEELDALVEEVELISGDVSLVDSDLRSVSEVTEVESIQLDVENIETGVENVLSDLKSIKGRSEADLIDGNSDSVIEQENRLTFHFQSSRVSLLSALHSLDAVKGYDEKKKSDNRTQIPISKADIHVLRNVLISSIALHNTDTQSKFVITALNELHSFLQMIYAKLKEIAALGAAGGVLYLIVEALRLAIEKLGTAIQATAIITV